MFPTLVIIIITDQVKEMLEPTFSDKGSTKRVQEEQAYVHFCDFLDECEGNLM